MPKRPVLAAVVLVSWTVIIPTNPALVAAPPTVEQALQLTPLQSYVEYDAASTVNPADCKLEAVDPTSGAGWIVRGLGGHPLRRFLDTNKDNKIDLWCYYQSGIETYRDVDSDTDGRADQYRWLGTAGSKWGLDRNEDGKIDAWKSISAEEVSQEMVIAIRDQDVRRFQRLLLTSAELKSLGLGEETTRDLAAKVKSAQDSFAKIVKQQSKVKAKTEWVQFGASRPGIIPAGTEGSTKDLTVYDNVVAMIETDGSHDQLILGTLIRVGDVWRAIDLPAALHSSRTAATGDGFFFQASLTRPVPAAEDALGQKTQQLLAELERIDQNLLKSESGQKLPELHAERADVLEKIAAATSDDQQQGEWLRQLADTVSAAVQAGHYDDGATRLQALVKSLGKQDADRNLVAYVQFRYLAADYGRQLRKENADFGKIQERWLQGLQGFVKQYPDSPDTAEAMMQLAIALEFSGQEKEAQQWYGQIISDVPESAMGRKAGGAKKRLESVGRTLELSGTTVDGRPLKLSSYRGKIVLLHYWATWCEPCKQDIFQLKRLYTEFGSRGFAPVGINLDSKPAELQAYLREERLAWPQMYEEGGLESRLAIELGILTLPTMMLIDRQGKVINRNIHIGELESELKKLAK
jgi:peroxiredoxin